MSLAAIASRLDTKPERKEMGTVCRNCGRGCEYENDSFICDVCGAQNNADGSVEYDGSHDAVDEMQDRIRDYDDRYDY